MPQRLFARLAGLNRTAVFLVTLGAVLLGFFLPGAPGGLVLLVLAGLLAMLLSRTWPVQSQGTRAVRLLLIALLVFVAATKFNV